MARKRRLNLRFILPTVCGVAVAGGAVVVGLKYLKPRNPQAYIAAGDKAMKDHDWQKAIADLTIASELLPQDPKLHLELGQAYYEVRNLGGDNFSQAVNEFTKAEELDPNSKDAWNGLLNINELRVDQMELRGGNRDREQLPISINMAREAAQHLVKLDPANAQAKAAIPILLIRTYLLRLTMPHAALGSADEQSTPEQVFERAISDLSKMALEQPENEKIPFWIARAKIFQAQQAVADGKPTMAAPLFAEASNQFEQSLVASPDVVALYLSKAQILNVLTQPGGDPDPQHWVKYRKAYHETLDIAQNKADPKNIQQYQVAKQLWAAELRSTDPAQAEAVFRDLIAKFPQELVFRQLLAEFLQHQPNRIDDALVVLNEIPKLEGPPVTNIVARSNWDLHVAQSRLVRADIETDLLKTMGPGQARDELKADIQKSTEAATKVFGGTSALLRVQGKFLLYDGQTKAAIQTLTQAADKHKAEHAGDANYHPDAHLLGDEAEAYRLGGQLSKAIEILEKAAVDSDISNNSEYQSTLATLYLDNQDYEGAVPHIHWIAARYPDDARTLLLQIRQLGPTADWAHVQPLYDKLPEHNKNDLGRKYAIAAGLKNQDESIRTMSLIHDADPGDISATAALVQMLVKTDQRDKANKVLSETKALHPDDPTLKVFDGVANNASSKSIIDGEFQAIMAIKDPFQREGKLAEFYRLQDNPDEEMKHLQAALAISPDDKGVLGTIFIRHLDAKRFADAEAMIDHMSKVGKSGADDAKGLMLRCKLALAKQDIPNALIFGRQMTNDNREFAGSYEMYGEALHAKGELDAAVQQFLLAIQYQATNVDAWKNLILCSVQLGKFTDARGYINNAIKRFPGDPTYRDLRVQFEIQYGDPTSILPELTDAVQQHPDEPRNYGMLADALTAAMHQKSQQGQADAASQYFSQTRDTLQKAVAHWPDDLRFTYGLSEFLKQNNDFPGAEECLKAILARPRWKDQPAPLIMLGKTYLGENKNDEAAAVLKQAMTADSHSVEAYLAYADCLIIQKKYEEALASMMPVTSDFRIRVKYVDLLVAMNRGPQAEADLQDAIKASPANTALVDLLLHVYDAEGEFDRGIRAASDVIQNDPRNIFAYLWRGKMESDSSNPDWDAAVKDLIFFRDAIPTSVEGRMALAKAYDGKRDRDAAIHELEVALQFDTQNAQIRLNLLFDYLSSNPIRSIDAQRLLNQTLAIPGLAHDPQFLSAGALYWAKSDPDKAVGLIKDAMSHTKADLYYNYFEVLLKTEQPRYLQMLLDDSEKLAADPKSSWFVYNDRGAAKAGLGQRDDAAAEFTIAMDRAGAQQGRSAAETVAVTVSKSLGVDKALEMVVPRAQNSVTWKLIAITQYIAKGDTAKALPMAESALTTEDTLSPQDKMYLYQQATSLYLNSNPPQADKAVEISKKILKIRPDDMDALNNMACILVDMSTPTQPGQALVYSQRAYDLSLKTGKLNPRIYDTHGWVLIQNNKLVDGVSVLHSIPEPDFPEAYYHLGVAYLQQSDAENAQRQVAKALAMLAAHEPVDLALKEKVEALSRQVDDLSQGKPVVKSNP